MYRALSDNPQAFTCMRTYYTNRLVPSQNVVCSTIYISWCWFSESKFWTETILHALRTVNNIEGPFDGNLKAFFRTLSQSRALLARM